MPGYASVNMAGHFSCTHEALHRFTATSQSLGPDTLQLTEEDLEFVSEYLAEQYSRPVTAYDVAMSEESGIASASARINDQPTSSSVEQAPAVMAPETFSYIGYAIAEESRAGIAQKLREVEELLAALKLNVAYMPQTTIAEPDERNPSDDSGGQCYELVDRKLKFAPGTSRLTDFEDTTSDYETMSTVSRSTTLPIRKQPSRPDVLRPVAEEEDVASLSPYHILRAGERSYDNREVVETVAYVHLCVTKAIHFHNGL
ncbi:hypothetical protein AAVH_20248 [Aphelenchoides avenae]|nr:hypothetical protein AAVH_20248 [Aphelenchus avenae]